MVTAAKAGIENLSPADVEVEFHHKDVLLVDLREPNETRDGVIAGAVLAPRGMLEFNADPSTPYHLAGFDRSRRVILYCGSGARSALGAKTLQELGYTDVAHLARGFKAWKEAGKRIDLAR
jgi:rhodanese-related sulfurtransferase